jgi:hypothetical protein
MLKKKKTTASGKLVLVKSVRRTRSHRINSVFKGAWGRCPQQAACGEMDSHKHCLPQYATHKIKKLTTGRLLPPIVSFLCLSDL